ncbi:sporulation transcriptional regulator SpoIIID [Ruminococcus flavefaciens]|uniref:sporulation transcriptional regulator SpoIIID n=1 Tax=Ruminococcus flavefaciens TaxID=1265 RepID=UPI0005653E94|nr:sporulation transcriptional regulator SpoIIID [Ruminococcus flavefaciens]
MKTQPEERAVMLGRYIIENRTTVRGAAKNFGISKSTVHKDVSERLRQEDPELYDKVKDILEINKKERHIRGGLATKRKYAEIACRRKNNVYYK